MPFSLIASRSGLQGSCQVSRASRIPFSWSFVSTAVGREEILLVLARMMPVGVKVWRSELVVRWLFNEAMYVLLKYTLYSMTQLTRHSYPDRLHYFKPGCEQTAR